MTPPKDAPKFVFTLSGGRIPKPQALTVYEFVAKQFAEAGLVLKVGRS